MCIFDSYIPSVGTKHLALSVLCSLLGYFGAVKSAHASSESNPGKDARVDAGVGLALGMTSGFGPNLRLELGRRWGLSTAAMIVPNTKSIWTSVGLQAMRTLWYSEGVKVYAVAGAHHYWKQKKFDKPFLGQIVASEVNSLSIGAGFGIEARFGPFGLVAEPPLTGVFALTKRTDLRFPGRVNYGLYPNVALCAYIGAIRRLRRTR